MQYDENTNGLSVEKYMNAITIMSQVQGKLDGMRLNLYNRDDMMSLVLIESAIKDLSKAIGNDYKMIDVEELIRMEELKKNKTIPTSSYISDTPKYTPRKPIITEIIEDDNINYGSSRIDLNKYRKQESEFAQSVDFAEKTLAKREIGRLEINAEKNKLMYTFSNSHTLSWMMYDKKKKELIVEFTKNQRIYKYNNIGAYIFQNIIQIDEAKESANSYFQREVCKQPKIYPYKEITQEFTLS